ncbi:hypothetical protein MKW98_010508, partial [Papaver atlanticum]
YVNGFAGGYRLLRVLKRNSRFSEGVAENCRQMSLGKIIKIMSKCWIHVNPCLQDHRLSIGNRLWAMGHVCP